MLGQEGVAIVGEGGGEVFREVCDLVVRDDEFRGCDAGELVDDCGLVGEFGDDEFAGGVIDGGEAVAFADF